MHYVAVASHLELDMATIGKLCNSITRDVNQVNVVGNQSKKKTVVILKPTMGETVIFSLKHIDIVKRNEKKK